jgi:hypothetical protein
LVLLLLDVDKSGWFDFISGSGKEEAEAVVDLEVWLFFVEVVVQK